MSGRVASSGAVAPAVARGSHGEGRPTDGSLTPRSLAIDTGCYLATAAIALVAAGIVLGIWNAQAHATFWPATGDGAVSVMVVKMIISHGSVFTTPNLGAPHGLELYDFPFFLDLGSIAAIWFLGLFSSDPALVFNAYFFLGFGVCAANAFLALRVLGIPRAVSIVCGVLYGLLPYHILRGEGHAFIGAYWAVPLAGVLILGALGHVRLFSQRDDRGSRWTAWLTPRTALTVACGLAVGTTLSYYALFTLMLLGLAGAVRVAAERRVRAAFAPLALIAVVGVGTAAMVAPTLLYRAKHGVDEEVARRQPVEAEIYALKLTNLVLPLPSHRLAAFRDVARKYSYATQPNAEQYTATLGLALSIALFLSIGALLVAAVSRRAPPAGGGLLRDSGLMALLAFLLGTVGGGSALIAFLLTSQLRGWGRIAVFIAFFALVALAALLTKAGARLRRAPYGGVAFAACLGVLGLLGVLDQTSPGFKLDSSTSLSLLRNDGRFVRAIEQQLPRGAMVLQLPYVPFPEGPATGRMQDYDLLVGYLYSDRLRWSYGAMKGRHPDDWGASMSGVAMRELVPAAVAAGFRGVYIDTFGYADDGAAILREVGAAVGTGPTLVSENRRLVFFSLAPVLRREAGRATPASRQAAADALVRPVHESWNTGFYDEETNGTDTWHWARQQATLTLHNPAFKARRLRVSFVLSTPRAPQRVTIRLPGDDRTIVTTALRGTAFRRTIVVPPGESTVRFATSAPDDGTDPRDLHLQVVDARFVDAAYSDLARRVSLAP